MSGDGTGRWRTTRRAYLARSGAVLAGGLLAGCSGGNPPPGDSFGVDPDEVSYDLDVEHDLTAWEGYDPDWSPPTSPPEETGYTLDVLAENLEIPWDVAVAPTGELFITERTGRVLTFDSGAIEPVVDPADVIDAEAIEPGSEERSWLIEGGEGGLLGIAVHPGYPEPPIVYTYATTEGRRGRVNRVTAYDVSAEDPNRESWTIVDGIPGHTYHNGGRIAFGPANYLWIAAGDGDPAIEEPETIADPGTLGGTILRVEPDGSAPADNPDIGDGADPRVYTYGHRNPQGLAWLPDGTPVITEHGPGHGDEVNVLRPGANYGWPFVRNSGDFDDYAGTDYQRPVTDAPDWAPSGSVFYTGDDVPTLRNRLLVGGLISQRLLAVTVAEDERHEAPAFGHRHDEDWMDEEYHAASTGLFADELGRIRHVAQGLDGELLAITSNRDGRADGPFPTDRDDVLVRIGREG